MSRERDWLCGRLTDERAKLAAERANRQSDKYPDDRGDFEPYMGVPKAQRHLENHGAQQYVAQELGRKGVPRAIKVQWTPEMPPKASLKVSPEDDPRLWVLVTGRFPDYCIVGAATVHEAKALGAWKRDAPKPAWRVRTTRLPAPIGKLLPYKRRT